jgi:hypothetical protein
MKLRELVQLVGQPNATFAQFITDNPSTARDWSSVAALFDSYRCCAIKLKYIPDFTQQSISDSLNAVDATSTFYNVPIYIFHDTNSVLNTTPSETGDVIEYENVKIKRLTRMFTYYRKMRRNIPINTLLTTQVSISTRGYNLTTSPVATQTVCIYMPQYSGAASTRTVFGNLIITRYCVFKETN